MDIYLDCRLPCSSSGLPGDGWETSLSRHKVTSLLLDLAPHGGYRFEDITTFAGGLLHHLFTLTPPKRSGILSVALIQALTRFRVLPGMLL